MKTNVRTIFRNRIILAHLNIRSIKNRDHPVQIRKLVEGNNFNIIAISESWLNNTDINAEVEVAVIQTGKAEETTGRCMSVHLQLTVNKSVKRPDEHLEYRLSPTMAASST